MTDVFMILMPREVELLQRPILGEGENPSLLRQIVGKLNPITGDLTLTGAEYARVIVARRNWRLGNERQFQALLDAAARHL